MHDNTLPVSRDEIVSLLRALQSDIGDEYRAYCDMCEDDSEPSMLVTICAKPGSWSYQIGDLQFMGASYTHPWTHSVALGRDDDDEQLRAHADEILEGLAEAREEER